MTHALRQASLFAFFAALAGCGPNGFGSKESGYSLLHGDSGIKGKDFDGIVADVRTLAGKHADLSEVVEYGQSTQGKHLTVLKIWDKALRVESGKRPAVLISEGIHGNEYLNISDRLPEEFLEKSAAASPFKQFIAKGGVLYVVPILNPDGYGAGQRENAAGQDLNRDFTIKAAGNSAFTQPETKGISDYMAKEAQAMNFTLEASMEYHCCIGGLIHPWAYTANPLSADALARHVEVGEKMKSLFGYQFGTVREIVGYDAVGGSDDYYLETYGRRAFSFEGAEGQEQQNLQKHVDMWQFMFGLANASATSVVGGGTVTPPTVTPPATNGTAQPSEDLYLAIAAEPTDGSLSLVGAAADTYDGMTLCYGTVVQCLDVNGSAKKVPTTAILTTNGRRLFRAAESVQPAGSGTAVTMIATKGGRVDAQSVIRAALIKPN